MGIRGRSSMPRDVLEHRSNTTPFQPLGYGARDRCDFARLGSVSPVANDRIGAGNRHIRKRQAIDGNAEFDEVGCDQPRTQPSRGQTKGGIDVVERAEDSARRVSRPVWRTEALDPAALLIDQNRRSRLTNRTPKFTNKTNYLCWCLNIPLEQNKAPRPLRTDEFALFGTKFRSGYACDECAGVHGAD